MTLHLDEQETIITFNRGEKQAQIFTYDSKLKSKLARAAKKHPDIYVLKKKSTFEGAESVSFVIPKDRLSINILMPTKSTTPVL